MNGNQPSVGTESSNNETTDEFTLEQFCELNNISSEEFKMHLSVLYGPRSHWRINAVAPDEHAPRGRLHITHPDFNDWSQVTIDNRSTEKGDIVFSVFNPMETDILTVVEDVSFKTALTSAVERANSEHERFLPTTPLPKRIHTRLSSLFKVLP